MHERPEGATPFEVFVIRTLTLILERQDQMAATMQDALDALSNLQTDVTALIAQGGSGQPVDFQPIVDATNRIDAQVKGATTGGGTNPNTVAIGAVIPLTPAPGTAGVTFASSDPTIATVDNQGNVTGVSAGQASITDSDASGAVIQSWVVTVVAASASARRASVVRR